MTKNAPVKVRVRGLSKAFHTNGHEVSDPAKLSRTCSQNAVI